MRPSPTVTSQPLGSSSRPVSAYSLSRNRSAPVWFSKNQSGTNRSSAVSSPGDGRQTISCAA